jgi:hypothetical protein
VYADAGERGSPGSTAEGFQVLSHFGVPGFGSVGTGLSSNIYEVRPRTNVLSG